MNPPARGRLLLVEDDLNLRQALSRALTSRGFSVAAAAGCTEALEALNGGSIAFAVLDLRLPDGSGLDLVPRLLTADPDARIVVLTGWGSVATAMRALRLGAVDFLAKPCEVEVLVRALLAGEGSTWGDDEAVPVPSLDRVEWEHLQRVLEESQGNISLAARRLGLHRRSLQRKLNKRPPST